MQIYAHTYTVTNTHTYNNNNKKKLVQQKVEKKIFEGEIREKEKTIRKTKSKLGGEGEVPFFFSSNVLLIDKGLALFFYFKQNLKNSKKTKEKDPLNPTREMEKAGEPQKTPPRLIQRHV